MQSDIYNVYITEGRVGGNRGGTTKGSEDDKFFIVARFKFNSEMGSVRLTKGSHQPTQKYTRVAHTEWERERGATADSQTAERHKKNFSAKYLSVFDVDDPFVIE